jgi:biopolymer transport protein ExbD/biopolymer transport protein TolR
MVDVMLVLLIIFMVIIPMLTKGAQVTLVKARNAIAMKDADKEDAVLIAITRDGRIFLSPGNLPITTDQIPSKVKDLEANRSGTDKTVFIKADYRTRFESVTDVIDDLRTAGVDTLGLLTEPIADTNKNQNL